MLWKITKNTFNTLLKKDILKYFNSKNLYNTKLLGRWGKNGNTIFCESEFI
jgi:hypothetical protein